MTSGGCEILHADCIEVLQTLAENSFDALITDPPYSSGGQYRGDRMQSVTEKYSQSGAKAEYLKHAFEGDNMDQRAWTSWTAYWLELCRKAVKPGIPMGVLSCSFFYRSSAFQSGSARSFFHISYPLALRIKS